MMITSRLQMEPEHMRLAGMRPHHQRLGADSLQMMGHLMIVSRLLHARRNWSALKPMLILMKTKTYNLTPAALRARKKGAAARAAAAKSWRTIKASRETVDLIDAARQSGESRDAYLMRIHTK